MKLNTFFSSIDISATGLSAQRKRLDNIASNIANAHTTRTKEGGPYRRRITLFEENNNECNFEKLLTDEHLKLSTTKNEHLYPNNYSLNNKKLTGVNGETVIDQSAPKLVYDPTHPDANSEGYVAMPNINIVTEMTDMISASRSYEANVTSLNAAKDMAKKALMI